MAGVGLDVRGPWRRGGGEGFGQVSEEGSGCVLKAGQIAGHGGEEAVGGFLGGAELVLRGLGAAGGFDEFAQGDGGTAGLAVQPGPVAGEKGDFARDDAGTGAGSGGGRGRPEAADFEGRSGRGCAEVEFDLVARDGVEDEDGFRGRCDAKGLRYSRKIAGGE